MILADKIINERKKLGWSQEELAEQLDVSRQSVSKWESAQSIPELTKIIQMADIFGVSTDYLLKDDIEPADSEPVLKTDEGPEKISVVTLEQANEFMAGEAKRAPKIALGALLCILSPVAVIVFPSLQELGTVKMSEGAAVGIGLAALFILIAVAVFIFITAGGRKEKYDFMETDGFETAYGVSGVVKAKKEEYHDRKTLRNAIGVVLCILAVLPLIIFAVLEASDSVIIITVGIMFVFIAAGVYILITTNMIEDSYNMLLQERDFTKENKEMSKKLAPLNMAYWPLAVVIFFIISYTVGYDKSWIVFVAAGLLYAPVRAIVKSLVK